MDFRELQDLLEEALVDILPSGFHVETDKQGELVIHTCLSLDEDDEVVDFESDEEPEDDEEDPDFDPDFEPLDEDLEDEDD